MSPKPRIMSLYNPIRASYQRGLLSYPPPHLLYANIDFGTPSGRKDGARLLKRLRFYDMRWTDRRILTFLKKNQEDFRRCLEWLSNNSIINLDERFQGFEDPPEEEEWLTEWRKQPEVRFLQLHAFDHGGIKLTPSASDGAWYAGIEIDQKTQRDPLDTICWYLVSRVMVTGTAGVRKCKYGECGRFFEPLTERKLFHSDPCRANYYMSRLSREEKRERMRKWRKHPMRGRRRKRPTRPTS